MQARYITREQIETAAAAIGVAVDVKTLNKKGDRHQLKVSPIVPDDCRTPSGARKRGEAGNAPYQRTGVSTFNYGSRVHAVCWHGFRDFFRACFRYAPAAVFRTAVDTWNGAEDFEARYRASGIKNIGSPAVPVAHCAACVCPDAGESV